MAGKKIAVYRTGSKDGRMEIFIPDPLMRNGSFARLHYYPRVHQLPEHTVEEEFYAFDTPVQSADGNVYDHISRQDAERILEKCDAIREAESLTESMHEALNEVCVSVFSRKR